MGSKNPVNKSHSNSLTFPNRFIATRSLPLLPLTIYELTFLLSPTTLSISLPLHLPESHHKIAGLWDETVMESRDEFLKRLTSELYPVFRKKICGSKISLFTKLHVLRRKVTIVYSWISSSSLVETPFCKSSTLARRFSGYIDSWPPIMAVLFLWLSLVQLFLVESLLNDFLLLFPNIIILS